MENKIKECDKVYLNGREVVFVGESNNLPMVNDSGRLYIVSWKDLAEGLALKIKETKAESEVISAWNRREK